MRLTGTWEGEYTYGEGYETLAGKSVPFRLSLTESGLGAIISRGSIRGYVRDDASKGGQPERGLVHGRRSGAKMQFVKTMPVGYVTDEEGQTLPAHEYFERHDLTGMHAAAHIIVYRGTLSEDQEKVQGTWKIPAHHHQFDQGYIEVPASRGTWSAHRASSLPTEI